MAPTLAPIQTDPAAAGPLLEGANRTTLVAATLARHHVSVVSRHEPVRVDLDSRSLIVAANNHRVWCVAYPGLAGLFRKDTPPNRAFGRALCDDVKDRFDCGGFFTSDELPRYGITERELAAIRAEVGASEADCVMIYAYPKGFAGLVDDFLFERLGQLAG